MTEPRPLTIPDHLLKRLEARGAAFTAPVDTAPTETPDEAQARHLAARAAYVTRWGDRLPVMYADASLADLADTDPGGTITGWLDTESATLVLAGSVGTGKTHAAYAIGNTAVNAGTWVEAWTVADLMEALRPGGEPQAAVSARRCDLLILDDLGATKVSEWAAEQMTALVDARLREGRRQVVTTNHPYEALEAAWGGRTMDRLRYRWTVVALTGESRRKAAW